MSLRGKIAAGAIALCSSTLVLFLGTWEGNGQNTVYADKLAGGLPTVCKGITHHTSPYPVVVGDYWSDARCNEVEQLVISKGQLQLADCITNQQVGQNTFDALSSHGHNFGTASTCASRAVGLINAGRIKDGCQALAWAPDGKTPVWAYVTGPPGKKVFIPGLHARRLAEAALCEAWL
ncbi:lysozyme [Pseudomonas sp. Leaf59]|uniref:lysozyme n=1 Tax=Pseudomonas sp. Leaf59 TaxID=2876556 RepID=UPI001E55BE70|nr:lysozyme [Pseudomonas sp. Leaf59]